MLGAFTLGLCLPDVLARAGGPPHPPPAGTRAGAPAPAGGLDPLHAYYQTLGYLQQQYFGSLPGEARLTYAAIRGLIRPLDDPFTRFLDPVQAQALIERNQGGYVGVGALLEPTPTRDGYARVHSVQAGTRAQAVGLRPRDVILRVNGVSTRNRSQAQVARLLHSPEGTPLRLAIRRGAAVRPLALTILPQLVERPSVESEMQEGRVGVIRLLDFSERSDAQVDRALTRLEQQGMRALILDLRGNPGGTLDAAQEVASRFLPRGQKVVTVQERDSDPQVYPVLTEKQNHRFNRPGHLLPLVVLVNRTSASAAEIVAGAIKDYHAGVILGTRTYGKGLVQTVMPLHGGCALAITTGRYLTPSGHDINRGPDRRGGIIPDIVVEATEQDWIQRRDVQLHKALALLHEKIGYRRPARSPRALS